MAAKTDFKGSFTALVTPFKNGSLDEAAFRGLVSLQIAEGTHGLVPVGTTGESPTLSHDEHRKVVEWCVDEAKGRVPVIAGTRPLAWSMHHSTTRLCSSCDSVGLSPVVPTGTRPLVPSPICHSTKSRKAFSSSAPF